MSTLLKPVRDYLAELRTVLVRGWGRYWFTPMDPVTIAFVRICTGLVLSYVYLTCIGDVAEFVGPHAWIDASAIQQLRSPDLLARVSENRALFEQSRSFHEWYFPSVYRLTDDLSTIRLLYGVFLVAMICLTLGFRTRTAAVLSWIGHLSFAHRGYLAWFGIDCVLAMITLYLLFAPCGAAWSIDSVLRRAEHARRILAKPGGAPRREPAEPSWTANVVIRLLQVNMCLIYFCAGCSKLQGSTWWSGQAVWLTLMIPEFRLVDVSWIARIGSMPWLPELVSNLGVAMTIAFEGGFPFLVHVRVLRPLVLFTGVVLHAGIGLFMGLGSFGAAMLSGIASFLSPGSLHAVAEAMFQGPGGYRFVFDRSAPGQVALASFLHAADPFDQVELVDAAASPGLAPGSLIAPDGTSRRGFAAFGRCLRVLRPMWVLSPVLAWRFARVRA